MALCFSLLEIKFSHPSPSRSGEELTSKLDFFMTRAARTDATYNIQQCWELLANNVALFCKGL